MIEIIAGIYTGTDFAVGEAASSHKDRGHGGQLITLLQEGSTASARLLYGGGDL